MTTIWVEMQERNLVTVSGLALAQRVVFSYDEMDCRTSFPPGQKKKSLIHPFLDKTYISFTSLHVYNEYPDSHKCLHKPWPWDQCCTITHNLGPQRQNLNKTTSSARMNEHSIIYDTIHNVQFFHWTNLMWKRICMAVMLVASGKGRLI